MNKNLFLLSLKDNLYMSYEEGLKIISFRVISQNEFLIFENEKKTIVPLNKVFSFNNDFFVFVNKDNNFSILREDDNFQFNFPLMRVGIQNILFIIFQIENLSNIIKILIQFLFSIKIYIILILLICLLFGQKKNITIEGEFYSNKFHLKKYLYSGYKEILMNISLDDLQVDTYELADFKKDKNKLGDEVINKYSNKKNKYKKDILKIDPDIEIFLKLKK